MIKLRNMTYKGGDGLNLNAAYVLIRERQQKALNVRRKEAYARDAELEGLVREYNALQQRRMGLAMSADLEQIESVQAQIAELDRRIDLALQGLGLPSDALKLAYDCPICKDYGMVEGRRCSCSGRLSAKLMEKTSGVLPQKRFEDFSFDHLPPDQARELSAVAGACERFCAGDGLPGLFLFGGTGTGKSMLLHSMGNRAIAAGMSVRYLTTAAYNRLILQTVVGEKRYDELDRLLGAQLLLLDDIGSESRVNNITEQYILQLVDTRLSNGRRSAFATNQTPAQLMECYGERIASRLLDKTAVQLHRLNCPDYRLLR